MGVIATLRNVYGPRGLTSVLAVIVLIFLALGSAGCGDDDDDGGSAQEDSGSAQEASGPSQGEVDKIAAFGLTAPETNRWDAGGKAAFEKAGELLGAETTWLSNIAFDQSPQVLDRLARDGNQVMISNGSGFADGMLAAAEKYPDQWFWVYSALAETKGLPNVVGIDLHWNEVGYLAASIGCMASKSKKIGLVMPQPIPAYTHAAGGVYDGVEAECGSERDLQATWTGTFDDNAKAKQAAEALIAQGADVIIDFQDAATPGVQSAVKEHPNVRYVGTMFDWADRVPDQIVTSVAFDYESGYLGAARLLRDEKLEAKVYPSGVETGGIVLTDFENTSAAVEKGGTALYENIKSGDLKVDLSREVSD